MAEESNGISSEPEEVSPNEATQEILEEGEAASVSAPLRGRVSLGYALARAAASIERFFRSIGGSKMRLSVAAGLFAALATAIGFVTFDAQREQWALKQKYPAAVSSASFRRAAVGCGLCAWAGSAELGPACSLPLDSSCNRLQAVSEPAMSPWASRVSARPRQATTSSGSSATARSNCTAACSVSPMP